MNKLAKYLKEREDMDSIETDYGFVIYKITGDNVYLRDIYVEEQFRQVNHCYKLADKVVEIAKEQGCKTMTGSVAVLAKNPEISIKTLLGYGMSIQSANNNFLVFVKEI